VGTTAHGAGLAALAIATIVTGTRKLRERRTMDTAKSFKTIIDIGSLEIDTTPVKGPIRWFGQESNSH
jgi:hypothetical protein